MAIGKTGPKDPLQNVQEWCKFLADAFKHPVIDKDGRLWFEARLPLPRPPQPVSAGRPCAIVGSQLSLSDAIAVLGGIAAWTAAKQNEQRRKA